VKIERIRIDAFGRFSDFDSGAEPLQGLNVVLGPNEAGKSTLFHFLTTMMYGFQPASREANPYSPWDGLDASGSLRISLESSGCADIERQLRSQPSGKMTFEGTTEELRNRALPWVEAVPRSVFSQVFAVTLGDLAGLDAETWAGIQDRLLGAMGASDILPARTVAGELEQEAGAIWRPHRRGNQRVRDLQEEIGKLRVRRRDAADRDRDVRHLVGDLESSRGRLTEAKEERERQRVALERVEILTPIRARLVRIDELRAAAGPIASVEGLPTSPEDEVASMDRELARLNEQLEALLADSPSLRDTDTPDDDKSRRVLSRAEEIRALGARGAGSLTDRARSASLELDLLETERQLDQHAATVLEGPWRQLPRGALASLPMEDFRQAVGDLRSARDNRRILEASAGHSSGPTPPGPSGRLPVGAAVLGGTGLIAGSFLDLPALVAVGGGGVALAATLWFQGRQKTAENANPDEAVERAVANERSAGDRARGLMQELPIRPDLLGQPDELLVAGLDKLQGLVRDHERRTSELRDTTNRIQALETEAQALAASLGFDSTLTLDVLLQLFESEVRRAERATEVASQSERELARLGRDRGRMEADIQALALRRATLVGRLAELGKGDLRRGFQDAEAALQGHQRADQLEAELESAHPDLNAIRDRIIAAESSSESWTVTDDDLARRRVALQRLGDEIEDTAARAEALDRDLVHSRGQETVDTVDGEIATLTDEETRQVRERDRKWILAQLLREADRSFREEHQPDLIRRAGKYLSHLTGGRYDRILVDETSTGDIFRVTGPDLQQPMPLTPPISTGTLEQAYLSLRLAIVDHLDKGGERLPLFMDEAFVNWDPDRRDRGMAVLTSVSRTRQVFVFTCHPNVASALGSAGARVIELDRDS
jgi:uncharacterized protein YhaN